MLRTTDHLTVGEVAQRSGYAASALRFYERAGLIKATRTTGNQRRYERGVLRRLAFIRAARNVGLTLEEVRAALDSLPAGRTPTRADWARLSHGWRGRLDRQINALQALPGRTRFVHRLRVPVTQALRNVQPGRRRRCCWCRSPVPSITIATNPFCPLSALGRITRRGLDDVGARQLGEQLRRQQELRRRSPLPMTTDSGQVRPGRSVPASPPAARSASSLRTPSRSSYSTASSSNDDAFGPRATGYDTVHVGPRRGKDDARGIRGLARSSTSDDNTVGGLLQGHVVAGAKTRGVRKRWINRRRANLIGRRPIS